MPGGRQFQPQYGPPPPGYPGPRQGPPPGYPPQQHFPPQQQFQPPRPKPRTLQLPQPQLPPQQQFAPPQAGYGQPVGPPVVIDVGKTNGRKVIIGATVAGGLGLTALISGIMGAVDGGAGVGAVVIIIGLLLLILPIATFARREKVFRPQRLVFEANGVRWVDPHGAPWAVPWTELAAVVISKHSPQQVGSESLQDKLVGAASDKIAGERAHVRLDLYPADPAFAGRHPEMAHLWERQGVHNGYRLPLGSNVQFIPTMAGAMGRFAPGIYRGVQATEGFMGLT